MQGALDVLSFNTINSVRIVANGILVSAHPSWDKSRNEVSYLPYIVQVEPLRLLEVQLYGATLAGPLQRVVQSDVYLGPVERTVARV